MRGIFLLTPFVLFASLASGQGDGDKIASGPQVGKTLPASFDCLIVTGDKKGRQHDIVSAQGLNPAVLIFAQEPAEGKDGPLMALLTKLNATLESHQDRSLAGAVIFLSDAAKNSANNEKEEDPKKLVNEAKARTDLMRRLAARTDKLKALTVACLPEAGPAGYKLNPKAKATVLIYERHKVLANFAFAEDQMTETDIDRIIARAEAVAKKAAEK